MTNLERTTYFLVYYDEGYENNGIETHNHGLVDYLKEHGFKRKAGYCGCPWYFVDINNKTFKPGRPGVSYGEVIGEHAITFDEFKTIYEIFERYEGLGLLKFEQ